jgi:glycerol kinase
MLGRPIIRLEHSECETRGSAFVAGLMIGIFQSYKDIKKYIKIQNVIQPDKSLA